MIYIYDENNFIPSLDIYKINFSDTFYTKNINNFKIHYIDISYKMEDLVIQLSRKHLVNIIEQSCIIKIDLSFYNNVIKKLEEYIIDTIYKNSDKWFSKLFTKNKIKSGLISIIKSKDLNLHEIQLTLTNNTKFFDRHSKNIKIEDFKDTECEIICLVKIANLQFINNKYSYNFELIQGKVFYDNNNFDNYSIIENVLPDEYYKSEH